MPVCSVVRHPHQGRTWSSQLWVTWCVAALLWHSSALSTEECSLYVNEAGANVQNCSGKDLSEVLASQLSDRAEVLDFSRNRFTTIPVVSESKECPQEHKCGSHNSTYHCRQDISFSRNQIYNFSGDSLASLVCLRTLDLSFNELTAEVFHSNTFQLGVFYLQRLLLNNNPLGSLPGSVITQPFLPHLWELNLSHCDLEELDPNSVDDFGELEILDLSFNKLKAIDGKTFKGLSKLKRLDLRENQLTELSESIFGDLVSLEVLLLSDNNIQVFHDNAFYGDSKLKTLDLRGNQLTSVPYTTLVKLTQLQTLDLSQNPIQQVTRGPTCRSLGALTLDDMPDLSELGPYSLASFPGLESLSVSGNKALETIHPKFLGDNLNKHKLKHIRLENNKLSTLSGDSLPWKQLEELKVGGNSWYCDSQLEWMIRAESIQSDITCSGPITLKGENIKNVNPADLSRDYALKSATAVIIMSLCLPIFGVCVLLIWRRRRYCPCVKVTLKGQYVTLFTREMDEDGDQRMAVALKVNGSKLSAISNGNADDTRPFIKLQGPERLVHVPDEEDV